MTKSVNSAPTTVDYMKRHPVQIDKAATQPLTERDIAQILIDLDAADDNVRAAALCRLSPCHMPWAVYEPVRTALKRLHKDPSLAVRDLALHVEQNAEAMATLEALRNLTVEDDDDGQDEWKQRERKRNKQRHRRRGDNDGE